MWFLDLKLKIRSLALVISSSLLAPAIALSNLYLSKAFFKPSVFQICVCVLGLSKGLFFYLSHLDF